jgi:hypothetical protein
MRATGEARLEHLEEMEHATIDIGRNMIVFRRGGTRFQRCELLGSGVRPDPDLKGELVPEEPLCLRWLGRHDGIDLAAKGHLVFGIARRRA